MKIVYSMIKRLFFSILYLFAINVFLSKLGYVIPVNIFSIGIIYIFKFPGLILLLFLSRW